jgi:hypothetical protein
MGHCPKKGAFFMSETKTLFQEIAESPLSIEEKIEWHAQLCRNAKIGPPMQALLVAVIKFLNLGGSIETRFPLPNGIKYLGEPTIEAREVVSQFKLEYYLTEAA